MKKSKDIYPYRMKNIRQPGKKRVDSVKGTKLEDYSVALAFLKLLTTPFGFVTGMSMIFVSAFKFFLPQYLQVIHLKHIPVKHVDHKYDEFIPYKTEFITTYLQFVKYWIRPMVMLTKRFGWWNGAKLGSEYMNYLSHAYRYAWEIYSQSFTTTYRPAEKQNKTLRKTQNADPHFMCVPSLHISVCALTISFYRMLFQREKFSSEEAEYWDREIYGLGKEIAESVLYLKQHSVNCIPSALYMISKKFPELFPPEMAVELVEDFLSEKDDITEENKKLIREHILFQYERFLIEGIQFDNWKDPVLRWLKDYEFYIPSYAKFSKIK